MPATGSPSAPPLIQLRLGSFCLQVECAQEQLLALLEMLWRIRRESPDRAPELRLRLSLDANVAYGHDDSLSWHGETFRSDLLMGEFQEDCLNLHVNPLCPRFALLDHYLLVALNSVLRRLGVWRLHAGAALWQGRTLLLVGPKGSGKSTLSLLLSRSGGTVLAEDQLLLRREPWRVSGCDGRLRLTEASERYFFPQPLSEPSHDYAGTLKKEIELSSYGQVQPYVDHPPQRLYFPFVGSRLCLTPIKRTRVVQRLLQDLLPSHRFADAGERERFLDDLASLATAVEPFALELSPRLDDLPGVLELLA